jgi:hypothetical protein
MSPRGEVSGSKFDLRDHDRVPTIQGLEPSEVGLRLDEEFGILHKLIPVPRHLSSDCGVCLRIPWEKKEEVLGILTQGSVKVDGAQPHPDKS